MKTAPHYTKETFSKKGILAQWNCYKLMTSLNHYTYVWVAVGWLSQGFWIYLYFRIKHSCAHLRPVILSAVWSIRRLQSWTCSSLPTVAEFVKLRQRIAIEIQRQFADLHKVQLCNRQFFVGVPAIHVVKYTSVIRLMSPAWTATKWRFVTDKKKNCVEEVKRWVIMISASTTAVVL